MKRYAVRFTRQADQIIGELYVTRWGRVANFLHLPSRRKYVAKFTETFDDC